MTEIDDEIGLDMNISTPVLSTSPQMIGHSTVQHVDDSDIFNGPGPTSSSVPPPLKDPHEVLGTSNSNDDSWLFLGEPEPEFFGKKTPPLNSLIGAAALKQLIDGGEEVYTINIQPTSDYMDISALWAVGHQPAPMSTITHQFSME